MMSRSDAAYLFGLSLVAMGFLIANGETVFDAAWKAPIVAIVVVLIGHLLSPKVRS